jgi:hypothetical protein
MAIFCGTTESDGKEIKIDHILLLPQMNNDIKLKCLIANVEKYSLVWPPSPTGEG